MGRVTFILLIFSMALLSGCMKENSLAKANGKAEAGSLEAGAKVGEKDACEKGYNLPIDEEAGKLAEEDCRKVMGMAADIYINADRGTASNTVLSEETILQMKKRIGQAKMPVTSPEPYAAMENYKKMEEFLHACENGEKGSIVIYELNYSGSVRREEYIFDGTDMYLLAAGGSWNRNSQPTVSYLSYTRLRQWEYTKKGWFCYELCAPEYPEVTERVDAGKMIRVKPMTEEKKEMSEKCVLGLGYQGNNLLCSNWDAAHMEELDFNGMYEYLYAMKYGKRFCAEDYPDGIFGDEFESLIMEYLPITAEQIREYAVYNEENRTYPWERLGCMNYSPTFFGTCLPEVVDIRENKDGTVTLTTEAVCEAGVCDDAFITHELTVRLLEDGRFYYLGNRILNGGTENIPDYQYRIPKE